MERCETPRALTETDRVWFEKVLAAYREADSKALSLVAEAYRVKFETLDRDLKRYGEWQAKVTGALILLSIGLGWIITILVAMRRGA